MAALGRIEITGYGRLLDELYGNWLDLNNDFSKITHRVHCCTNIINNLISEHRVLDAKNLFRECEKLEIWNHTKGIEPEETIERIREICDAEYTRARDAIQARQAIQA